MAGEIGEKSEQSGSRADQQTGRVESKRQDEDRRFKDALEDDEVREALKLRGRKKRLACDHP